MFFRFVFMSLLSVAHTEEQLQCQNGGTQKTTPANILLQAHMIPGKFVEEQEDKESLNNVKCSEAKAAVELVFLVDGSGSIGQAGFAASQNFMTKVVENLAIGEGPLDTRVAIVQFSSRNQQTVEINLELGNSLPKVLKAVKDMKWLTGTTYMAEGIDKTLESIFPQARNNAQKILVVIADGRSAGKPGVSAAKAHSQGIQILAIGVQRADETQMKAIAGGNGKFMYVQDYSGLAAKLGEETTKLVCKKVETPSVCDESYTNKGADYVGCQRKTRSGRTCQRWDQQSPHKHKFSGLAKYENFCRNPDNEPAIWCYTTDPGHRWEFCDPLAAKAAPIVAPPKNNGCDESYTNKGADYVGCQRKTRSGRTCQRWDQQSPHKHKFSGLAKYENFCRNPDNEPAIWCYTTDPGHRWEFCDPLAAKAALTITTCGGTAGGATCAFPFKYKGTTYTSSCTTKDNDQPWCYTDSAKKKWGNCQCD